MISINDQRVLAYEVGAGFTDLTKEMAEYHSGSSTIDLSSTKYLYFGSFLPFNNKYFKVQTPNATVEPLVIEIFDGTTWVAVNEIFDYTDSAGASLAASGTIQFSMNRSQSWALVGETETNSHLTEFSNGPDIYDKYWLRINTANPIQAVIKYIGSLFCNEEELLSEYPALTASQILTSWQIGKTDWEDQRVTASEYIITDLKRRNIIIERSQVIETSVLTEAAIHKTAEIIYNGLGPRNFAEEIIAAGRRYTDSMNLNKFEQDANQNGQKETSEQNISTQWASR